MPVAASDRKSVARSPRGKPESLILVERAENSLFVFEREMARHGYESCCVPCIADIGDQQRMRSLFELHRPQIVFHAAAHKHVPLMEANPSEAVKNKRLGDRRPGRHVR